MGTRLDLEISFPLVNPLKLEPLNQTKSIPIVLLSFPNHNLRQIGLGVPEIWSDRHRHANRKTCKYYYLMYIRIRYYFGNPALPRDFPIKVNPLNFKVFKTFAWFSQVPQSKFQAKSVKGFLIYGRTTKQTNRVYYSIDIEHGLHFLPESSKFCIVVMKAIF